MTLTLKKAIARLRALPPEEQDRIGRRLLDELAEEDGPLAASAPASDEPQSLADWLDGYIGTFDSREHVPGGASLSVDTGRRFAEGLEEKRQRGRL